MTGRPMALMAIDPGSERSAWVVLDEGRRVLAHAKGANEGVLDMLRAPVPDVTHVVIEHMSPRGMPTSAQEMETLWWAGRLYEAASAWAIVHRVTRDAVKLHLAGRRSGVTDATVRALLIDRYGGTGGRAAAVGTKARPGPLHGVRADEWQCIALGLCYLDGLRECPGVVR